jgi:hypothetical protein
LSSSSKEQPAPKREPLLAFSIDRLAEEEEGLLDAIEEAEVEEDEARGVVVGGCDCAGECPFVLFRAEAPPLVMALFFLGDSDDEEEEEGEGEEFDDAG